MIPLSTMKLIQIEVTNACHLQCANCTRFVGHHKKPFFMNLDTVAKALESLQDFPGHIGLMGGEPTMHPQFAEICKLFQKLIQDRQRRELWTAGHKWETYRDVILETFEEDHIAYNDHSNPDEGGHQPLLIAIAEVIDNKELMWKLVDNCWVQQRWSASITPKGAFFCEVAAAQDYMFDGPGGWPIGKGWWDKTPAQFHDQVQRYCVRCSAALPMPIPNNHENYDLISPGNARLLEQVGSPKYLQARYQIADLQQIAAYIRDSDGMPGPVRGSLLSHPEWTPWYYRGKIWHGPGEGTLTAKEVRDLQMGKITPEQVRQLMASRTPKSKQ